MIDKMRKFQRFGNKFQSEYKSLLMGPHDNRYVRVPFGLPQNFVFPFRASSIGFINNISEIAD